MGEIYGRPIDIYVYSIGKSRLLAVLSLLCSIETVIALISVGLLTVLLYSAASVVCGHKSVCATDSTKVRLHRFAVCNVTPQHSSVDCLVYCCL